MTVEETFEKLVEKLEMLTESILKENGEIVFIEHFRDNFPFYLFENMVEYREYTKRIHEETRELMKQDFDRETVRKVFEEKIYRVHLHGVYLDDDTLPTTLNMLCLMMDSAHSDVKRSINKKARRDLHGRQNSEEK